MYMKKYPCVYMRGAQAKQYSSMRKTFRRQKALG